MSMCANKLFICYKCLRSKKYTLIHHLINACTIIQVVEHIKKYPMLVRYLIGSVMMGLDWIVML